MLGSPHTGRSPFIGPQSSTIKWTWDLPIGNSPISPVLVRSDGTIIIALREGGNHKGSLYAVSSAGSFKWKSPSFSISEFCCWETMLSPAIGSDGTIYVGGTDKLYALNSDGGIKWDYALKSIAHGPQIVIGKDEMINVSAGGFFGGFSGMLALNPNGTLNWQLSTEPPSYVHGWYPPALGQDGTVFTISSYSSDNRASVEAIDQQGVIKWRTFFDINGGVSIPSVATNGDIYLAAGGTFRAFNSTSGDLKFDLQTREENQFSNLFPTNFVIADDDSLIIGVTKYQENSEIMAVNPNGNIKWSFPLTLNDEVLQPIVDANGTAYVGVNNRTTDYSSGKLLAINSNGTLKWSHTINTVPYDSKVIESLLALSSDRTLYFISGSKLYALGEVLISHENNADWPMFQHDPQHTGQSPHIGPHNPVVKWTFSLGGQPISSPIIGSDGTVYIATKEGENHAGRLYAVDSSGMLKWQTPVFPADMLAVEPAIGPDGTIYVGGSAGSGLYALTPDGATKWRYIPPDFGYAYDRGLNLVVTPDGTIYGVAGIIWYGMGSHGHIFALNPDGSLQWFFSGADGDVGSHSPTIGPDGALYATYKGFRESSVVFHAIDKEGQEKWMRYYGIGPHTAPTVAISEDGVLYWSVTNGLSAFNSEGTILWTNPEGTSSYTSIPTISPDGTIIVSVSTSQGNASIKAFNPDGSLKWTFPLNLSENPWIPITDAEGTIYVATSFIEAGNQSVSILAINSNGSLNWRHTFSLTPVAGYSLSPMALSANRTLYMVTLFNDRVYKLIALGENSDLGELP